MDVTQYQSYLRMQSESKMIESDGTMLGSETEGSNVNQPDACGVFDEHSRKSNLKNDCDIMFC